MTEDDYRDRWYKLTITHGVDVLTVDKCSSSALVVVRMQQGAADPAHFTLRSLEHAEALHFMLGQLLRKDA